MLIVLYRYVEDICPGTRMRLHPKEILKNFDKLAYPLEKKTFEAFCRYNFVNVPYLVNVSLPDYKARPRFLDQIRRKEHLKLAESVHFLWNKLARKFTDDVLLNASFYPVVPVTNNFVVPGGKFQIFFYWDSYWILKGLYLSELLSTAKGMIQNFADVIYRNGFIPNSGSVQLSRRSQPPLFAQMVKDYFAVTKDVESLRLWTPSMDKEMRWWIANRSVSVELPNKSMGSVFLYRTETNCPRPENYLSDYLLGMNNTDPLSTWKAMSTACESGWDFSTRWFDHDGERRYRKDSIRTQTIVPVDLNVYMALNFKFLADSHAFLGNISMSDWYKEKYRALLSDIQSLSWNEDEGVWFDYDLLLKEQRKAFYPSNVFPLLLPEMQAYAGRVLGYLEKEDVFKYPGGIPATLPVESFEQWDFPNVWAPTQHLFIHSLLSSQHPGLKQKAMEEAEKFIATVYNGLFNPQEGVPAGLWEKYDARSSQGKPGDGGEYIVQEGFGWTNGVVMDLINMMNVQDGFVRTTGLSLLQKSGHSWIVILAIVVLLILAAWFAICGHFGYVSLVRDKVVYVREPSSRRLLEDSDSSE
ncbi:unnamed protein product [Cylicocyclus nassatus]|uniref:Trehalase n=1 Tax=Cylicocyclus nassatus TaxID=53992 RepID=A0AA36MGG9_CYLNA|nr:unnamed protein product [Cylicocyclus nassatus]